MNLKNKETLYSLDIAKFICAFLIILIHASPFYPDSLLYFGFVNILARVAVPLFFAISGFLFFRKITFSDGKIEKNRDNVIRLFRYVRSLVAVYILTSLFYLLYRIPYWYSIGWWGFHALKDYIVSFFLSGSEYHLWYLLASIYGIILFYMLLSFVSIRYVKYLCAAGWIIECLLYSYSWLGIENIEILNTLTSYFSICFDAAFRAIPLMGIGLLCATCTTQKKRTIRWGIYTIASFILLAAEASVLRFHTPNDGKYSYILLTPVFTCCALNWLLSLDFKTNHPYVFLLMRKSSLLIYCLHPMLIYCLDTLNVTEPILKWCLVTLLSVVISMGMVHLTNVIRKYKILKT